MYNKFTNSALGGNMPIFRIGNFDDFSATFAGFMPPMDANAVSENAGQHQGHAGIH